jgi:Fe(3+) dicitrate transport protein
MLLCTLLAVALLAGESNQPSRIPSAHPRGVSVSGRVTDTSGAGVPGAPVTARRVATGQTFETATDGGGRYTFENLAPGGYEIAVALHGFATAQQDVTLGTRAVIVDLVLRPGALAEELDVLGSRMAGSEEMLRRIPGSIDLLTRDALDRAHVFTTSEALRQVPGINVRDEEGFGLRPNIGVRGLNPTRSSKVLLLEDGVPTTFAPYGDNASYYHPPIDRFARVEVLKGSSQIAYGPVTIGAAINYVTPEPPQQTSVAASVVAGTREYLNADASIGGTWKGTGLFVGILRKQGDGARDNVHAGLTDVLGKVTRQLTSTQNLTFKANYYGEDSQVTYSGLRESEYRDNPRQNMFVSDAFEGDRVGGSAVYRALVGSRVALTTTVYGSQFERNWWRQSSNSAQRPNDAADPGCGGMANLNVTCGNEGRLRRYTHGGVEPRARVGFGIAGVPQETDLGVRFHVERQYRRQANGDTPLARTGLLVEDNRRTTDAFSAFVQHRVLAGAWTITPGLRVERVGHTRTNRLLDVSGESTLAELVPGLGLSYAPSASSTIFAGVHRGFAPPRVEDVISNSTGGVVELDPERSWNYEIGGRSRLGVLHVDGALFRMDYENQIVAASLAGGSGAALTNGGETLHQGVEVGLTGDWEAIRASAHGAYTRLALTWLPVARFTGRRFSGVTGFGSVSVAGNRLPYAPETTAMIAFGYRHRSGFDAQIEAQHVSDQFSDDLNTIAGTPDGQRGLIPAYTYWNAAATWRVPHGGSIFLTVKNLADQTFIVDRARGILPGHPRLVQIGTSWRF